MQTCLEPGCEGSGSLMSFPLQPKKELIYGLVELGLGQITIMLIKRPNNLQPALFTSKVSNWNVFGRFPSFARQSSEDSRTGQVLLLVLKGCNTKDQLASELTISAWLPIEVEVFESVFVVHGSNCQQQTTMFHNQQSMSMLNNQRQLNFAPLHKQCT